MMRMSIVVLLVVLSTRARAEDEPDASQVNQQSETSQRQQAEIKDLQEDDVTRVEPEELEPTDELRDDVVEFYGSARVVGGFEGDTPRLRDNLSRAGLYAAKDFAPGYGLFARLEVGVNLVDTFDRLLNPKANAPEGAGNVVPRLGYLGVDSPFGQLSFGKQWSPYRAVAVFTDRHAYSGGLASASFNAGTDGGATGSGRAQSGLYYHMKKRGGLDVRFQWQPGDRPIPGAEMSEYGYGLGASAIYEWGSKLSFGAAYNLARVPDVGQELEEIGITGDAEAFLLGAMYVDEPLYLAVNYVQHKNHDTDDRFKYIDARGVELYARYTIAKRYRGVTGFNFLDPRKRPDGGRYNVRLGFIGFQYSLRDEKFRDILFVQFILDNSLKFDGSRYDNAIAFGFRWNIDI